MTGYPIDRDATRNYAGSEPFPRTRTPLPPSGRATCAGGRNRCSTSHLTRPGAAARDADHLRPSMVFLPADGQRVGGRTAQPRGWASWASFLPWPASSSLYCEPGEFGGQAARPGHLPTFSAAVFARFLSKQTIGALGLATGQTWLLQRAGSCLSAGRGGATHPPGVSRRALQISCLTPRDIFCFSRWYLQFEDGVFSALLPFGLW